MKKIGQADLGSGICPLTERQIISVRVFEFMVGYVAIAYSTINYNTG